MTVTVPSTVGDLLRDTLDRDAVAAALPTVSGPLEELLLTRVLAAVDAVLDVDLACVLLDGWKTYGALVEAARRTQEPPAASETVPLHHQELTWTSHPSVEIFVNGKKVATLAFDLTVTADVAGVSAEVRAAAGWSDCAAVTWASRPRWRWQAAHSRSARRRSRSA